MKQPRLVIVVPSMELLTSLWRRLGAEFPGEAGTTVDQEKNYFAVEHFEFPKSADDVESILHSVQSWLAHAPVDNVTVETRWFVERTGSKPVRRVLTWKLEEASPDPAYGNGADSGPAWLDVTYESGRTDAERIENGAWITRDTARLIARTEGYELSEDG